MKSNRLSLSVFVALAAMLSVSPAVAQGRGHDKDHGRGRDDRERTEVRREDRRDDRRDDSRFERRSNVPRGWCQGRGNPHNTARNCGYRGSLDGLYRDRSGVLRDRNGRIVFTASKGLTGVGFPRKGSGCGPNKTTGWEDIADMKSGSVSRTIIDDTLPGGPVERTITNVAPFDRCDRVVDYRVAWQLD